MSVCEEPITREDFRLKLNQIRERAYRHNKAFDILFLEALKRHDQKKYFCMGPGILVLWLDGICAPYPDVRGEVLSIAESVVGDRSDNAGS